MMSHVANKPTKIAETLSMLTNNSNNNAGTSSANNSNNAGTSWANNGSCKDDIVCIKSRQKVNQCSQQKSLRRQLSDQLESSATTFEEKLAACAGLQEELKNFKASIALQAQKEKAKSRKKAKRQKQEEEAKRQKQEEEAKPRQRSERRKLTLTMRLESYQDVDCKCNNVNSDQTQRCQWESLREEQFGLISAAL